MIFEFLLTTGAIAIGILAGQLLIDWYRG